MSDDESRQLLGRLLDSAIEGVVVYDAEGIVRYANQRAHEMTGCDELVGMLGANLVHPEDLPRAYEAFLELAAEPGSTVEITQRIQRPDGEIAWIDARLVNHLNDPDVEGIVSYFTDVTARRAVEDQLRHSQRLEIVGQTAGFVAHDLSNFLVVVSGNADLVRLSNPSETTRRAVEHISVAAERASQLTRRLLTFSQRGPVRFRGIDVSRLLNDLMDDLRRLVPVNLSLNAQVSQSPIVYSDATYIEQIVLNLVLNAREALNGDGHIDIGLQVGRQEGLRGVNGQDLPDGTYVTLSVSDDGRGIPPESVERIFEPYFSTRSKRSSGMGLTIVSRLVDESDGAISVESEVDQGTTISIHLPIYVGEIEPTSVGDASTLPTDTSPS